MDPLEAQAFVHQAEMGNFDNFEDETLLDQLPPDARKAVLAAFNEHLKQEMSPELNRLIYGPGWSAEEGQPRPIRTPDQVRATYREWLELQEREPEPLWKLVNKRGSNA